MGILSMLGRGSRRGSPEAADFGPRDSETITPKLPEMPAAAKVSASLTDLNDVVPEAGQSEQTVAGASARKGGEAEAPAAGLEAAVDTLLSSPDSSEEGDTGPQAEETTESGLDDDLMSLFTEEDTVNEDIARLAGDLEEVDGYALVEQCREVAAQLRSRADW